MIIYHQNNVAAFAGNHVWYWPLQPLGQLFHRVGVTPAAGGAVLISQARTVSRFVSARVYGRVN